MFECRDAVEPAFSPAAPPPMPPFYGAIADTRTRRFIQSVDKNHAMPSPVRYRNMRFCTLVSAHVLPPEVQLGCLH